MKSSRRKFLQTTLTAPIALAIGGPAVEVFGAALHPSAQMIFQNPDIIRFDANCFTINGQDTFLRGGSFHYPRVPRELWEDRLLKLKRAGFNVIETYVFWNYHEPLENEVDLTAIEDFIKVVHKTGLWMIARIGPYVCAEWDVGGFPNWVTAMQFPLRSDSRNSVATSRHWYHIILPVIQKNQITNGGPIILLQIENEYDYWPGVSNAQKRAYVTELAEISWNGGIDIPLITNWTRQARENSYPAMRRLTDFCDFYPRWKIMKEVPPQIEKMRRQEPDSPEGVAELQGGWFSKFGGKLSVDQEGIGPKQLNVLTKVVMEYGVTFFNYYMGVGGTNFEWAAKGLTTTYDYAAPIREAGGLWDKYYEARGIGEFLKMFGKILARAEARKNAVTCTNAAVSLTSRVVTNNGFLFVRENRNAEQKFKFTVVDPASPSQRIISVPRQGELSIGPREMKVMPVELPVAGTTLKYSTAEILTHGLNLNLWYMVLYDDPGRAAEMAFATQGEPHVQGDTTYVYWDQQYQSVIIGVRFEENEKILVVNENILVILAPRQRALRTWAADFPIKAFPESQGSKPVSIPFVSDAALLVSSGSDKKRIWADLQFRPGNHQVTTLLPFSPKKLLVDSIKTQIAYRNRTDAATFNVETPALQYQPISITSVRTWIEKISDRQAGNWITMPLRPMEDLGRVPYNYVKFLSTPFTYTNQSKVFITTYADDAKKVFLNGKIVPEASTTKKEVEIDLAKYAKPGSNQLEISYELFGSPNFGPTIAELKGLNSAGIGDSAQSAKSLGQWSIQRFPAPAKSRGTINPEQSIGTWSAPVEIGTGGDKELVPMFTWCSAEFEMEPPQEEWFAPWKLTIEADRDALLYLNGRFVGRYMTIGPQKDFYLPEPFFVFKVKEKKRKKIEKEAKNILTVVLAYTRQAGHIHKLQIVPYGEFATRRTRIEFEL